MLSFPWTKWIVEAFAEARGILFFLLFLSLFMGYRWFNLKAEELELRARVKEIEVQISQEKEINQELLVQLESLHDVDWIELTLLEQLRLVPVGATRIEHASY